MYRRFEQIIPLRFHQFARFALVGGSGVMVDFAVYLFLTRGFVWWHEYFVLANTISSLMAATSNFAWNRRWTFRSQDQALVGQYVRYLTATAVYLGAVQLGLWFSVRQLGLYDLVAKVLVLGVAVALYFAVVKRWVFRARIPIPRVEEIPKIR